MMFTTDKLFCAYRSGNSCFLFPIKECHGSKVENLLYYPDFQYM